MTHDEAKTILLLYRPGSADAADPEVARALAVVNEDSGLARWFEEHCARQEALRGKFREITAPAGLREQIVSEFAAHARTARRGRQALVAATFATILLLASAWLWFRPSPEDTFARYSRRMIGVALRGYAMDLETNNLQAVSAYLAEHGAPAGFPLPKGLQRAEAAGCAVQKWQKAAVAMVCFRTGKPLPAGESSDLWLFVVDRSALRDPPASPAAQLGRINKLMTAVWEQEGKVYLLGVEGDEQTVRQYLL